MNWTERLHINRPGALRLVCCVCSREFWIPPSQKGQRSSCSAACAVLRPAAASTHRIASGRQGSTSWDKRLNQERQGTVRQACQHCNQPFWVPPSKVGSRKTCSAACAADAVTKHRLARTRACETCGAAFQPSASQVKQGGGRYCSQRCNTASREALNSPEAKAKAAAVNSEAWRTGKRQALSGDSNPRWKGGLAAWRCNNPTPETRREDAARLRKYRQANPDKVREFAQRRQGRKTGRLPRGTINRIGDAQRWKCAICRRSVQDGYHMDHIIPLKLGGEHLARNIQLLCQTCNVRKNAKDPIEYMQSLGRLL